MWTVTQSTKGTLPQDIWAKKGYSLDNPERLRSNGDRCSFLLGCFEQNVTTNESIVGTLLG